jgi:AcrR family transcriptional regulator
MIGIREKKKQQTHKAIVDAAVKLFAENGFEETSMEELAREAGVGKSTIYGYFEAKEEIFLAYCEAELDYAFAMLDRKIDEDASLVDQLVAQMMGQITFVTRNKAFGRIFVREMFFPKERSQLNFRDLNNRYVSKLGEVLGRAQLRGELPPDTDLLLTIAHFHALYMIAISTIYTEEIPSQEGVEVLLRGLILQTLQGPAAMSQAPEELRNTWEGLKRKFTEQNQVEV